MNIRIYDTYDQMSRAAADFVIAQLLLKPESHIGLTAGKTPVGMFAALVDSYRSGAVGFGQATFYNLEEKFGLAADDPATCRNYFHRHLLDHTDITDDQLLLPDQPVDDLAQACAAYDALLKSLPGHRLDMQILGIGENAHIGMNHPKEALPLGVHKETRGPVEYAAMGLRNILCAERILLIANGTGKAQAVADMCRGDVVTTAIPATLLQLHPDVTVLLDCEAAALL